MAFKFGVRHLDRNDAGQSFADVVAGEVGIRLFEFVELAGNAVDRVGEDSFETFEVGTAFVRTNVIGKPNQIIRIGIGAPLEGCLDLNIVFFTLNIDDVRVNRCFFTVDVSDILFEAAFVLVGFAMGRGWALVGKGDAYARIQISQFPKATGKGCIVKFDASCKNSLIGQKGNPSTALDYGGGLRLQRCNGSTTFIALLVFLTIAPDGHFEPAREGVNHRNPNTVQATRHLVATATELTACMKHCQYGFEGRFTGFCVGIDWNPPTIINNRSRAIGMQCNSDGAAMTG